MFGTSASNFGARPGSHKKLWPEPVGRVAEGALGGANECAIRLMNRNFSMGSTFHRTSCCVLCGRGSKRKLRTATPSSFVTRMTLFGGGGSFRVWGKKRFGDIFGVLTKWCAHFWGFFWDESFETTRQGSSFLLHIFLFLWKNIAIKTINSIKKNNDVINFIWLS